MSDQEPSFETSFAQLADIVAQLEEGGLDLEESVSLFEGGMALAKECERQLSQAELKVEQLIQDADGETDLAPFQ